MSLQEFHQSGVMDTPVTIGVSSCLLGENVRYDGELRLDRNITDTLGKIFCFVAVCPEVGCGLPTPREAMRLEGDPDNPRLMTIESRIDKTAQMQVFCCNKVRELENVNLCGFIFKKNSPSCEPFRITVYDSGVPAGTGKGLFAAAVASRFPLIPLVEEGQLNEPAIRDEFIKRVFDYRRRRDCLQEKPTDI